MGRNRYFGAKIDHGRNSDFRAKIDIRVKIKIFDQKLT